MASKWHKKVHRVTEWTFIINILPPKKGGNILRYEKEKEVK